MLPECPCGRAREGCDYHDPKLQPDYVPETQRSVIDFDHPTVQHVLHLQWQLGTFNKAPVKGELHPQSYTLGFGAIVWDGYSWRQA